MIELNDFQRSEIDLGHFKSDIISKQTSLVVAQLIYS